MWAVLGYNAVHNYLRLKPPVPFVEAKHPSLLKLFDMQEPCAGRHILHAFQTLLQEPPCAHLTLPFAPVVLLPDCPFHHTGMGHNGRSTRLLEPACMQPMQPLRPMQSMRLAYTPCANTCSLFACSARAASAAHAAHASYETHAAYAPPSVFWGGCSPCVPCVPCAHLKLYTCSNCSACSKCSSSSASSTSSPSAGPTICR